MRDSGNMPPRTKAYATRVFPEWAVKQHPAQAANRLNGSATLTYALEGHIHGDR
jgi:hypothetical protein